jgi:iron complex outermembrane receptor protein
MKYNTRRKCSLRLALLSSGCGLSLAGGALAQTSTAATPSTTVEQVMVTAQKRAENVQSVPASVTPITASTIQRLHVSTIQDITGLSPNVQIQINAGLSLAASLVVRGIGISGNPSPYVGTEVGTVIDGVPVAINMFDLTDQFDVARMEVLKGPQGTLFGANTTGGVINIVTNQPTGQYGVDGKVTYGNYNRLDGSVSFNFPIIPDVLAGKVTISHEGRDGFYTNLYNNENIGQMNTTQVRGYLLWTPNSDVDVTLKTEVNRIRNGVDVFSNIAYPGEVFYRSNNVLGFSLYSDVPNEHNVDTYSTTLTANFKTSIGKITSITNYSNYFDLGYQDVAGIDCYCYDQMGKGHGWQESEELRDVFHPVSSVEVLIGGFEQLWGYTNLGLGWPAFVSPDIESTNYNNELSTNLSGFSQVYWNVTDRLRLQGGLRVSWDRVRMTRADYNYDQPNGTNPYLGLNNLIGAIQLPPGDDAPSTGEHSWVNLGGKFGADYQLLDNLMTYAYYARGFKSGGFNGRVTVSTDIGPYNPETVDSFEIGLKSDWLDKRVQINLAAFLNKWSDMQVNQVLYRGNPPVGSSTILNAGRATTEGVELESQFVPFRGLRLGASAGYLHAVYDQFLSGSGPACPPEPQAQPPGCSTNYSGRPLSYAPQWTVGLSADYTWDIFGGDAEALVQYSYDGSRWGNYTEAPSEFLPADSLVNANLSWGPKNGHWRVSGWARNLLNEKYLQMAIDAPPIFTEGILGNPREYGIDFTFHY